MNKNLQLYRKLVSVAHATGQTHLTENLQIRLNKETKQSFRDLGFTVIEGSERPVTIADLVPKKLLNTKAAQLVYEARKHETIITPTVIRWSESL